MARDPVAGSRYGEIPPPEPPPPPSSKVSVVVVGSVSVVSVVVVVGSDVVVSVVVVSVVELVVVLVVELVVELVVGSVVEEVLVVSSSPPPDARATSAMIRPITIAATRPITAFWAPDIGGLPLGSSGP